MVGAGAEHRDINGLPVVGNGAAELQFPVWAGRVAEGRNTGACRILLLAAPDGGCYAFRLRVSKPTVNLQSQQAGLISTSPKLTNNCEDLHA